MTVIFSASELQEITQWYNEAVAAGNRSAMYLGIAGLLQQKLQGASATDQAMLNQDILWLQGASQANLGNGVYATLIRTYTQAQAELRMGGDISDTLMQTASNAVGDNLYTTIQTLNGGIPDLATIAGDDAKAVGTKIFQPSIPDDSASTRNAGWSGTVLFSMLGSDQTSRLVANGSAVQTLDDARNVLFAMYSMGKALQSAFSTGESEAVQYFMSMIGESSAGSLLTDLSIGFNTLSSSGAVSVDNFFSMAAAFFKNGSLAYVASEFAEIGLNNLLDLMRSSVSGAVTTGTSDASFTSNAKTFFDSVSSSLTTWGVSLPDVKTLLADALNPSSVYDADRNALSVLSPIVVTGMSLAGRNVSLWQPGMTSGLTSNYLSARADMLKLELQYDAANDSVGSVIHGTPLSSQTYYDRSVSASPLYTVLGTAGLLTDITMFGGTGPETLQGGDGNDRLFGGSGPDTMDGGAGNNTLEGGSGFDTYIISGDSKGADSILDTDGNGQIEWKSGGNTLILTGGDEQTGTSVWKSADGSITYFEDIAADGSTELEITSKNKIAYIDNFTNGEFGITLNTGTTTPVGSSNLSLLRDDGIAGDTNVSGEAAHVYKNDLAGATVDHVYGADSSGNSYGNQIDGDGNASYIYAGNGANSVFLGDFDHHATDPLITPLVATLQGGSGNQNLVGVGNGADTILGGAVGADTSAVTYIDGGGATALLVGGGQNSVIFGGTGADTLVASSVSGTSPSGFNPYAIELAGLSFWGDAYSSKVDGNGKPYQSSSLPNLSWSAPSADQVQIEVSLYQSDDTFGTPFGLLGSSLNSGTEDGSSTLPGSVLIGGTGDDWLIGNRGDDTIICGDSAQGKNAVLVGGAGADVIYGGGGTEIIYADMSPGAVSGWADLDASHADTIYGGSGTEFIYGSGGKDVIYGGSGADAIHVGNGGGYIDTGSGNSSVYGGSGNDTIVADGASNYILAGGGNAYIEAARGNSTIITGAGDDTIQAAGGNALVTEGSGHTTLIAGTSTGSDTIQPSSGGTTVQLIDGLTESTLIVRDVNGDLVLSDPGFDTQVTVSGYFNANTGVSLQFADSTTWGTPEILQAAIKPRSDGGNDTLIGSDGTDSIAAGYGDTSIVGTSGDNTLIGGAGDDTIQGGSGSDTIEGGSGTTQILGGTGTETYVFNVGDGSDTIRASLTSAGSDTLRFGAGISASNLTYTYDSASNNLLIQVGSASNATITVTNFLATQLGQHQITILAFADGSTLSSLQVIQQAVAIDGTTGNDSLTGTSGMDYFDGKGGNDTAVGDGGNDTFVFNAGYGHLEINETYTAGQQPVLQLGTGIATSTLHVTTDGNSLTLADGTSGDQVTVDGMFSSSTSGVAAVQLADGTMLTRAQLIQMEMTGTTGNDTLVGTSGGDVLDGNGGNDSVIGNGGSDTFVFNAGYGHLDISENYNSGQQPVLQLGAGITVSTLHVTSNNTNLFMTDGVSGDQVALDNMWVGSSEGYGVAAVQLADGTTLTVAQLLQMELTGGTSGSDTIYGTSGADLIDGKGGNDVETGDGGSDTFVFDAGYGHLEINELNFNSGQHPVLQLGTGITASALRVTSNGTNLLLSDGVSGDQVTLDYMWSSGSYGVATVQLDDGTTLTVAQLLQMELTGGTSGNDTIYGTSGADLIDGKGGSDVEIGEGGNDTFVFNQGYGHLEVENSISTGSHPILRLGSDITLANLHVSEDADKESLYLSDGTAGDQVQLLEMLNQPGYWGVSAVELADGTMLTPTQLAQMEFSGTTGDDSIYGTTGADSLDGKGGDDYIYGDGGNDTFAFNRGYGRLDIVETYTSGQQPVLQLGAGIAASDLRVTTERTGTDLYLTDGTSGDVITLSGMWTSSTQGVAVVKLSDGTTLTQSQLIQMEMTGTTGDDTIYGTSSANLIDGKGGNDVEYGTIYGSPANDTFVFDKGYGNLTINQIYTTGEQSVLQLGAGITASSFRVMERNNINNDDLVFTDGTAGDEIDMVNMDGVWVGGGQMNGVQQVEFSDGTSFTWAQLQSMAGAFIYGTTGSDSQLGANSDTENGDYIDGKGGGDTVYTSGGNDTFVFNAGYGALAINATEYGYEDDPVLLLGGGIKSTDLYATSTYDTYSGSESIYITDGVSGDKITLNDMGDLSSGNESPILEFDGGTSMTMAQLLWVSAPKGTTGNDTIVGTWGNELIDAKGGDDSVVGNGGSDTFVFDSGYGQLEINESYLSGQTPVLQLGAGITAAALGVTTNGTDIYLTDGLSGDHVTLDGMGSNSTSGVAEVMLADGTTLTSAQLIQIELSGGTSGSDTLSGTSDDDLFDGKGGSDVEIGNGGNDTFVFNSGYGQLEINESYLSGQTPVLELGTGITASALRVTSDGTNLYLTDGVNGDRITLDAMWNYSTSGVAEVTLADGTLLTPAQLAQMELSGGTSGNDTLYGTYDDELIDGKGGNDSVVGNGGYDTFVFNAGYGDLEINESYNTDSEQPVLQLGVGISASTLHVTQSGNNLVMTDGVTGDQITLDQMWSSSTSGYGVATVQLADGTSLTAAQLLQMASQITGTIGNDTLQGTSGAELFDGMGGNDSVVGGGGNDTFVFNTGYGHLEINETHTSSQHPVLQLGEGITASALHVTEANNNLLLTDGVSGDQITLDTMWSSTTLGVATVQLADGTTLTRSQLIQMEMTGTTGNDTLQGTSGADLLDGEGGNDSIVGSGGNDTFVFNTGYGHLEINESFTSSQHPVLQLGTGITASTLHVAASGNNLLLTDGVSGDQVTLDTMWSSTTHGVATAQLADGTTLTRSQLIQMEMTGTTGNDTLQGTSAAELIDGKGGNDSVVGGGGNDTFVFNTSYGHLEINESFTSSQHPVLQLGTGITASTLRVAASGNNLLLTDGISGDQVTLDSMSSSSTHGVATVQLADGTTLTRSQLIQMETIGTTGNDTLQGTSAAELIDGKGGNDSVVGGGGNDTFVFNSGYGQLIINETHTSTQTPILQLGAGITTSTLVVMKSGSNLVLTDGVAGDQITLNNMSSSSTSGVATVHLADGTTLTRSQLIQRETASVVKTPSVPLSTSDNATLLQINPLIHAIASYTGNGAGGGMTSAVIPPATPDVMLHAAA